MYISMDFLNIGSTPTDEPCAQVGRDDYERMSRIECKVFLDQLRRLFPEPNGGYLSIKRFSHDFGQYREVVAVYDTDDEEATNWAFNIEANCPEKWDEQAYSLMMKLLTPENYYK